MCSVVGSEGHAGALPFPLLRERAVFYPESASWIPTLKLALGTYQVYPIVILHMVAIEGSRRRSPQAGEQAQTEQEQMSHRSSASTETNGDDHQTGPSWGDIKHAVLLEPQMPRKTP